MPRTKARSRSEAQGGAHTGSTSDSQERSPLEHRRRLDGRFVLTVYRRKNMETINRAGFVMVGRRHCKMVP